MKKKEDKHNQFYSNTNFSQKKKKKKNCMQPNLKHNQNPTQNFSKEKS